MSYCGGRNIFTAGQKERSRLAIKSSTRWKLLSSYACNGPPCDTVFTYRAARSCNPANAGIHFDTLSTSKGCDSIIRTTTTYIPPVTTQLTATSCDPLAAGIHQDTSIAASGCDSIVTTATTLIPAADAGFTFTDSGLIVTYTNASHNSTSYVWNFGDDSSSTETSPVHEYLNQGNYTVSLVAENSCGTDTSYENVVLVLTGIKNRQNVNSLIAYPNPNNGMFHLKMEVTGIETTIQIINLLGQTIMQQNLLPGSDHTISLLGRLAPGVYQLQARKNGQLLAGILVSIY